MLPVRLMLLGILLVAPAWAQDSASTHITLTIPKLVQISELEDMVLGEWNGSGDMQAEQQLCIWSSTGLYALSGDSHNASAGQFRLAGDENAGYMAYQIFWDDGGGFQELRHGARLDNLNASRHRHCSGENSLRPSLRVHVANPNLTEAAAGEYQDLLRLTIIAN